MTSRVGPRVRHCRGMRSFPRGVPRKFKRRDHPTLLSRGQNVCKSRVFFFFFFFIALPIIISRRPRVDLPNDLPPDVRSNALLQQRISFEIGGGRGRFLSMRRVDLGQETQIQLRIHQNRSSERVAFGLKTFAQVQEVIATRLRL